jgi:hypothetical protein
MTVTCRRRGEPQGEGACLLVALMVLSTDRKPRANNDRFRGEKGGF